MDETKKVIEVLEGPLREKGYSLFSVKLIRKKDGLTLEVVVDREEPISLEDIVAVSDLINPILDASDPISSPYTLDVSSTGAEKPIALEALERYLGRYVHLHLLNAQKGSNDFEGELSEVAPETVSLLYFEKGRRKKLELAREDIDRARLAIRF